MFRNSIRARRSSRSNDRRGTAVVEFAILLPVLLTVTFGAIEICTMIRTQQRLNTVAYEAARVATTSEATMEQVQLQCEMLCTENQLQNVSVVTNPVDFSNTEPGEWIAVTVTAPSKENSLLGGWLLPNLVLSESVSVQQR
jgi:hypothetical protein